MGKGVVSAIWEDEDMPVDDNGIRADIIMTPASIINRMNPSQLYEQFWNRASVQVIRNVKNKWLGGYQLTEGKTINWQEDPNFQKNWAQMYKYILEYLFDFRPAYAKFVNESLTKLEQTKRVPAKMEFVADSLNEGLYLINGFRDPTPPEKLIEVADKYGIEKTPITYNVVDQETGVKRTIRTIKPMLIGSKYLMLLGKIPGAALSSIELGYVNQFELPIKPKSKHVKSQAIVGNTPQKAGEDEVCMLTMSLHDDKVARFIALHSSAPEVVKQLGKYMITESHPSAFVGLPMHTQDIIRKNQCVSMLYHQLGIVGYDLRNSN